MLFTLTFPHFRILISNGPNFLLSFKFTTSSEDFAVILSNPIKIACEDLRLSFNFFSFKFWLFEMFSVSSINSSKLGFIFSTLIKGDDVIFSSE